MIGKPRPEVETRTVEVGVELPVGLSDRIEQSEAEVEVVFRLPDDREENLSG
jgi:hypothetical protein